MSRYTQKPQFLMKYGPLDKVKAFIHRDQTDTAAAGHGMRRLEKEDPEAHKAKFDDYLDSIREHGSHDELKRELRKSYLSKDKAMDVWQDPHLQGNRQPDYSNDPENEIRKTLLERQPNLPAKAPDEIVRHPDVSMMTKAAALAHKNMPHDTIRNIANGKEMIAYLARTEIKKRDITL